MMDIISHTICGEWEDWEVTSQSNPNKSYLVTVDHDENTVQCSCPDFHYRRENLLFGGVLLSDKEKYCKHIRGVLQ